MTKTLDEIRAEMAEQDRKHSELLAELEVPTYTERTLQAQWVQSKGTGSITGTTGWTAGAPAEVLEMLEVGDPYIVETMGFNTISGWLIKGRWYARKSDQDLQRSLDDFLTTTRRRHEECVAKNRDDWTRREAALPDWIAERMRSIRANSPEFETEPMGWGYELIVCELAVLYAAIGPEILTAAKIIDTPEIDAFADAEGTSGMQHQAAWAIAKHHLSEGGQA
jgi:hypothetical protein